MARAKNNISPGGNKGFIEEAKSLMAVLTIRRKNIEAGKFYRLREPFVPYNFHFGSKKGDIGSENSYFWGVNLLISIVWLGLTPKPHNE
jgi:uncharacterized membrane protein YjgN (DUF898 family)